MNTVAIKIQTKEDALEQAAVMPEILGAPIVTANDMTVCIMEDMTQSRKCGVQFVLHHPDGTYSTYLITEGNMDSIVAAYNGAKERFAELKKIREN